MADNMPLVARIMVQHGGDGPPTGPGMAVGGGGGGEPKQTTKNISNMSRDMSKTKDGIWKSFAKTIGIGVGISAVLKQSQIFTGYVGTIFQLMGALVDVILAPFLPIVVPALKLLASFIPTAQELGKDIFGVLNWIGGKFVEGFKWITDKLGIDLGKIPKGVTEGIKKVVLGGVLLLTILKVFGLMKFAKARAAIVGQGTMSLLKIIAVNTGRMGGAMGKGLKGRGRFYGSARKFFSMGLMKFAMIGTLLGSIGGVLTRTSSGMIHALTKGFGVLKNGIGAGTAATTRLVPRLVPPMGKNTSLLSRALGAVKGAAASAGRLVLGAVTGGFNMAKGVAVAAKDKIVQGAKLGFSAVGRGLIVAKDFIAGKFPILGKAVDAVKSGLNTAKNAIVGGAKTGFNAIKGGLSTAKSFIAGKVTAMGAVVSKGLGLAKSAIMGSVAKGKQWAINSAKTIGGKIGSLGNKLGGLFGGISGLLKKIPGVSKVVDVAKNVGKAVAGGLGKVGSFLGGMLGGKGGGGVGNVLKKAISPLSKVAKVIPGLNVVAEAGYGLWKTVKDFKEHGAGAGFRRLGATVALTGAAAGASFIPGGTLAVAGASVGSHMYLDSLNRNKTPRGGGHPSGGNLGITIVQTNEVGTELDRQSQRAQIDSNREVRVQSNYPPHIGTNRL